MRISNFKTPVYNNYFPYNNIRRNVINFKQGNSIYHPDRIGELLRRISQYILNKKINDIVSTSEKECVSAYLTGKDVNDILVNILQDGEKDNYKQIDCYGKDIGIDIKICFKRLRGMDKPPSEIIISPKENTYRNSSFFPNLGTYILYNKQLGIDYYKNKKYLFKKQFYINSGRKKITQRIELQESRVLKLENCTDTKENQLMQRYLNEDNKISYIAMNKIIQPNGHFQAESEYYTKEGESGYYAEFQSERATVYRYNGKNWIKKEDLTIEEYKKKYPQTLLGVYFKF